jgi:hypothetical protein
MHQPRAVERSAPAAPPVVQRAPVPAPQAVQRAPVQQPQAVQPAPTPAAPQQAAPAQSSRLGHRGDNGGIAERFGVQRPSADR